MQIAPLFQLLSILPAKGWTITIALLNLALLAGFIFFTVLNPLEGYKWFPAKAICTFMVNGVIVIEALWKRAPREKLNLQFGWIFNIWTCVLIILEITIAVFGGLSWIYPAYSTIVAKMFSMVMVASTKHISMEFLSLKPDKDKNLQKIQMKCLQVLEEAKTVEQSFSITLLGTQFLIFVQLILDFYNLYLALLASGELVVLCIAISSNFVVLSIFLFACEDCKNQYNKIGFNLHKLKFNEMTSDERELVIHFSEQLAYHDNAVQFTANEFFTLDLNLMKGMLATIATFLVILIQTT